MSDGPAGPSRTEIESAIAAELRRVHEDSYEAGSPAVEVHASRDVVLAVIDVKLTAAEQTLLEADQGEAVKATREAFQEAIAPTFIAIVEHATGRQVAGFLSAMSVDPLYELEFFRLAPEASP